MGTDDAGSIRALVQECVNAGRADLLDVHVAQDVRVHPGTPGAAPPTDGIAALREAFRRFHDAFPDLHVVLEDVVAAHGEVAARWTATGTHRAAFLGIEATGARVRWGGTDVYRLVDGRVVEWWRNEDLVELLRQLGRDVLAAP